jgi:hypothetical protein
MSKYKSLKVGSSKHRVHLCEGATGTGEKLFAYSYRSLAELFEVKETTVRQWINRKQLDPINLHSIIDLYNRRAEMQGVEECTNCGHPEPMPDGLDWCHVCIETVDPCYKPPAGWVCSRAKDHEGPCAASECWPCNKVGVVCPQHQKVEYQKCLCGHAEWCHACTTM